MVYGYDSQGRQQIGDRETHRSNEGFRSGRPPKTIPSWIHSKVLTSWLIVLVAHHVAGVFARKGRSEGEEGVSFALQFAIGVAEAGYLIIPFRYLEESRFKREGESSASTARTSALITKRKQSDAIGLP